MIHSIKQLYYQYIKGNTMVERFAKVFSVDVFVRATNFLLIPAFLHLMTQEEIGIYDYLYTFVFGVAPALSLGLYVSLTKMYPLYDNARDKGRMLFTIHTTLLTFLLIVFGIIYGFKLDYVLFEFLVNQPIAYQQYRFFILLAIVAMIYNVFLTMFFVSSEKISKIQRYNAARCVIGNIAVFGALFFLKGDKIEIRLAATYIIEFLIMLYFFRYFIREMFCQFSKTMMLKSLKLGMPIMFTSIAYLFINFADKYYVQRYCGIEEFAVYNKALQFALILPVIFNSFQNIWLPLMMKEKDLTVLRRKTNRIAKVVTLAFFALSLLIVFGVWLSLQWNIIPKEYYEMVYVLPLACIGQIFASLQLLFQYYMVYFEKTYINFVVSVVSSIASVILNYFAVQHFSYYGVITVMIFINIIITLFYYFRSHFYINNRLRN